MYCGTRARKGKSESIRDGATQTLKKLKRKRPVMRFDCPRSRRTRRSCKCITRCLTPLIALYQSEEWRACRMLGRRKFHDAINVQHRPVKSSTARPPASGSFRRALQINGFHTADHVLAVPSVKLGLLQHQRQSPPLLAGSAPLCAWRSARLLSATTGC